MSNINFFNLYLPWFMGIALYLGFAPSCRAMTAASSTGGEISQCEIAAGGTAAFVHENKSLALSDFIFLFQRLGYQDERENHLTLTLKNIDLLTAEQMSFLREVAGQVRRNQIVTEEQNRSADGIYRRLMEFYDRPVPPRGTDHNLSLNSILEDRDVLEYLTPAQLRMVIGLDPLAKASYEEIEADMKESWVLSDTATGTVLRWQVDHANRSFWTISQPHSFQTIFYASAEALRFKNIPYENPPKSLQDFIQKLKLPFLRGGRIAAKGSRSRSWGWIDSMNRGYSSYVAEDGRRLLSLLPIDFKTDVTQEIIQYMMDGYTFIDERAENPEFLARPVGIHYYQGQLRLLFESAPGSRLQAGIHKWEDLNAAQQTELERTLAPEVLRQLKIRGMGAELVLNTDYLFNISEDAPNESGGLLYGLEVRARKLFERIRNGDFLRLR